MAKKKKQAAPPKSETFKSSPFKALKGLAVAAPPDKIEQKPPAPQPPVQPDESALFLQAMAGVRRVGDDTRQAAPQKSQPQKVGAPPKTPSAPQPHEVEPVERETFAKAIGQLKLDKRFKEQGVEEEELQPLGGYRLRQLKRGVIELERQLDLHGLTREEALEALPRFLRSARTHGEKAVLIITGKGNNSPGEPVLQQAVSGWLRDAGREHVAEFAPAPRELGGSGAFVVFLRSLKGS